MKQRVVPWLSLCILLFLAATWVCAQTTPPVVLPAPPAVPAGARHALLVTIDGLRPDVLLRADAPNLRGLMKAGSFTMWAQTTAVSVTLPSHTSMLTGVTPQRHEIVWNRDLPFSRPVYPSAPTLFELAYPGYSTAMVAGKTKFEQLAKPGTLDWYYAPGLVEACDDAKVADRAIEYIRDHQPGVLFVHFPSTDTAGHAYGWGGPQQLAAVAKADVALGRVLAALDQAALRPSTLIILTADHGGAGRNHGPDDPRCRHIPWIIAGPGVRDNYDLTLQADLGVRIEDTMATAGWFLGVKLPKGLDGKPVLAAFKTKAADTAPATQTTSATP